MKYKLLSIENKPISNIGDYIQALASAQFLPQIDGFINREALADYDGEESVMIMNGWYMHDPTQWPPSKKIHPLIVSLHINKLASEQMLQQNGVNYLKLHEPIGCRDIHTRDLLVSKGINAYFSGCMTLTLGKKYKSDAQRSKVIFVDPIIPTIDSLMMIFKDILTVVRYPKLLFLLTKKIALGNTKCKNYLRVARYIRLYSKVFTKETLANAIYINQENARYGALSNEDKLKEAERLINLYAQAKLVITKRIHCALPCLGLGTPVYFIKDSNDSDVSKCRFGGLVELFNTLTVYKDELKCDFNVKEKLSTDNIVFNKNDWKQLAEKLSQRCESFISVYYCRDKFLT